MVRKVVKVVRRVPIETHRDLPALPTGRLTTTFFLYMTNFSYLAQYCNGFGIIVYPSAILMFAILPLL